ncbi:MAG TPA: WYL domain-containing protein [Acidimicrobiales bacterium]|nr:WYL domain-containing protein [Acidimicrobiales bacterium]
MDRLERLVNLVAALLDTTRPLTRAEIRERVEGYSSDGEAFRRNFERDKDLLRQMGFPVVTEAPDPAHPEETGYRIPREMYELPDPGLDDAELAALRLAASAVQMEGDWGGDAVVRALRKLGGAVTDGRTGDPVVPGKLTGLAALPAEETAATAFAAVGERRQVRFRYRGGDRLVDPWRLSYHRGHWYLSGLDHGRSEERLFRLDRVEGPLTAVGPAGAFARPGLPQTAPPPPWRMGEEQEQTAVLLVDADQAVWARQALGQDAVREDRPDGSVIFEVAVTAPAAFRSFVLGYLEHAEILGPPALRDGMISWLRELGTGPGGSDPTAGAGPGGSK